MGKVVEKERVGEKLPQGWKWCALQDVCEQDRKAITPNTSLAKNLPYLSLEHIESNTGRILREPSEALEDEGLSNTFAFNSQHVLYGKLRPYLNKVALPDFSGRCTTEAIPLLPKKVIYREYLAWILRRKETVDASMSGKTGSRMPRANMNELLLLEIPLPPLPEQKRIVGILSDRLSAVEQARAATAAQLAAAKALPAAYLRQVFDSPEAQKWKRKKLRDVLELRREVIHPRNKPEEPTTFVGLEHIQSLTGIRIGSLAVEMSELTGRKPQFYEGDIVYGYLRPYLNKVWLAEFDGLCSVDQYVFSTIRTVADPNFVAWFMRSSVYLNRAPIGDIQSQLPRIRTDEVMSVDLNLPSLEKQQQIVKEIAEKLSEAERLRQSLQSQLDTINQLPAALLRQAFNGEL